MTFAPLGDSAVVVTLGETIDDSTLERVRALATALIADRSLGVVDVVPAYASVTVFYEVPPGGTEEGPLYERICRAIEQRIAKLQNGWPDLLRLKAGEPASEAGRLIEVPICYGDEFGPDIEEVAKHTGLSTTAVASLHVSGKYRVQAVGFSPGFPYLGGLDEKLYTPRRPTPRTAVAAGSVGIGWRQTGIYPITTPGGWQIIGRTPLVIFDLAVEPPARFRVGDRVKFKPITAKEFAEWK
jgi:inhibitor of KinA